MQLNRTWSVGHPSADPGETGLMDLSRDALVALTPEGEVLYWNAGAARKFHISAAEALGQNCALLLAGSAPECFERARMQALAVGHWEGELILQTRNGTQVVLLSRWNVEFERPGKPVRILVSGTDIRLWDRYLDDASLSGRAHFEAVFGQHPDGVAAYDCDGALQHANAALSLLTGYDREELSWRPAASMVEPKHRAVLHRAFLAASRGAPQTCEVGCRRKDGSTLDVSITMLPNMTGHAVVGVHAFVKDISERRLNESRILYLANHDALTGLPNRNLLHDRMRHALDQARRMKTLVGVLFMDLNRFKVINDSLGHEKGDMLLCTIAERLTEAVREGDTVARIGGDEFVVMLENIHSHEQVEEVANSILRAVCAPLYIGDHTLNVSTSIGASVYPDDGSDSTALLKNADLAMYAAKEHGNGQFCFYQPAMNDRAMDRLKQESSLRRAIGAGELVLHYQPRFDVARNAIVGAEALVRWNHPEKGLIYPNAFIGLAEETGLIETLGEWVLNAACKQLAQWQREGMPPIRVSVNISPMQLQSARLMEAVWLALQKHGIAPGLLELEITESSLMQNLESSTRALAQFREMGIPLSIDDFGTGYSSLSYLKLLPINTLKIDKSFVRGLPLDDDYTAIIGAMVAMAHRLQLQVVAEGVVSWDQVHLLKELGCDEIQGYLLCQPLPSLEFERFLTSATLRGIGCGFGAALAAPGINDTRH